MTNTPTTWSPGCCTPRARWRSAGGLGGGVLVPSAGARRRDRGGRPRDGSVRPARTGRDRVLHGAFRRGADAGAAGRRAASGLGQQPMHHNGYMNAAVEWLLGDPFGRGRSPRRRPTGRGIWEPRRRGLRALDARADRRIGGRAGRGDRPCRRVRRHRLHDRGPAGRAHHAPLAALAAVGLGDHAGSRRTSSAPGRSRTGWADISCARPWRRPGDGCQARAGREADAEASFADAVRAASDTPGELLLALRLEVACWEERGDGPRLARAAGMLSEAAADRSPPLAAWAAYATALALLSGDAERADAGGTRALELATEVSRPAPLALPRPARTLRATLGRTEASEALTRAREILATIVAGLEDRSERASFVERSDVAAVLSPRAGAAQGRSASWRRSRPLRPPWRHPRSWRP